MSITISETINSVVVSTTINNSESIQGSVNSLSLSQSNLQNINIIEDDSVNQLVFSQYPAPHKLSHSIGGSDEITPQDIGAQNAWESPVFVSNTFTAQKSKHYIIKNQIASTPQVFTIVDPSSPSIGDFYILYHEGGRYVSIGGVVYNSRSLLLVRVYEAVGLSGQWKTQILSQPSASAKAWINFNGTGTVSIRSQFNISALIDNGIGDYTIIFASPMTNTNYSFVTWSRDYNTDNTIINNLSARSNTTKTTSSLRLLFNNPINGLNYDSSECNIIVFGE